MRRTIALLLALLLAPLACNGATETRSELALTAESEQYCALHGEASGRYQVVIAAVGVADDRSYGLASVNIAADALAEHPGVEFALVCEPPAIGPDAPFVIPSDPTSVVLPLVIMLPPSTPFSATCELTTSSSAPTRGDGCVPWRVGARVEARGLEDLTIDVVELDR